MLACGFREVLVAAAQKVGVDGAEAWLDDPNAGLPEVRFECMCEGNIKIGKKY